MPSTCALANAPFLECLPIGIMIFDEAMDVVFLNRWMWQRLGQRPAPETLDDLASWGDSPWHGFVAQIRAMAAQIEGDFRLNLGPKGRMQVTVSLYRLNAPLDGTIMVVSDISELRATEENLRETLAHVGELSDTMIAQSLVLKHVNAALEQRVRERTLDLRQANMDALRMLAVACEARDQDTGAHVERVRRYAELIAGELGLDDGRAIELGYSAILHDVGKVQVPDAILTKPGPLTPPERAIMQEHAATGERILGGNPFFAMARRIAREHHENWNGSGYPDSAAGCGISVEARIVHVADVFDALTSRRPYKAPWPMNQALAQIKENARIHFDPEAVAALESLAARRAIHPQPAR